MIGSARHSGAARGILLGLAIALLGWMGCGDDNGEEKLKQASREFAEARDAVGEARTAVDEQNAVLRAAQEELEKRLETLRDAQAKLGQLEEQVDLRATDAVLFRSIQKRLLEDGDLEGFAIAARVQKGAVLLSGQVSEAELRDRAVEIARSTPGVASVESRIKVLAPESED